MKISIDAAATLARLPNFKAVEPAHVVSGLTALLTTQRELLARITADPASTTWANLVVPMDTMADELQRFFSPVSHLHNVADSPELRGPYNECVALISAFSSELDQHAGLYACYQHLHDSDSYRELSVAQRKVIDNALRDFRLGGVALPAAEQQRVKDLRVELARLGTRFEQNVLDATQSFRLHIDDQTRLAGLPGAIVALARQNAEHDHQPGWTLTLDLPCYVPAMMRLEDRDLRHALYTAYTTRASDQAPAGAQFDNSAVMHDILGGRQALAHTLGFANYAELSLATKMAPSTTAVVAFLEDLAHKARPAAQTELEDLRQFAQRELGLAPLEAWDIAFCSEKYREHLFQFSQEDLKPYFPIDRVLAGLFGVAATLFDVEFEALQEVQTWHEDVRVHAILDNAGQPLGFFYLDLYARKGKHSGAWMDECLVRWRQGDHLQLPVAYLTCNFTPPVSGQPTLLTHNEVITLFHEFGHGLHHMLTLVEQRAVAGIHGVAWDAVELPSQILENWCWEREALDLIGAHHETGAPLPEALYAKLLASKRFQAAMQTLRQVELALFDFRLHLAYTPDTDIQALLDQVRAEVAVIIPPASNRFQHSFTHVFAGGYAAGYYSYKWAEVLAADAFARFIAEGIFNRETGLAFRHAILEAGGAEDAMALFKRFRGREPEVDALLRQAGLIS